MKETVESLILLTGDGDRATVIIRRLIVIVVGGSDSRHSLDFEAVASRKTNLLVTLVYGVANETAERTDWAFSGGFLVVRRTGGEDLLRRSSSGKGSKDGRIFLGSSKLLIFL